LLASTADDGTNRASTGRHKRVERKLKGARASGAHHDFNGARSGDGKAWSSSGRGEAPTAAISAGNGEDGSVEGFGEVELVLGGTIGGSVRGGAAGALEWLGKGARTAKRRSAARSPASVREKERVRRPGKAFIAKRRDVVPPRRLATQAAKQLRALTHAGGAARAAAAMDRAPRSTPATVAIHIPLFVCFVKIRPKSELQ